MTIDKAQLKALAEALIKATDAWHENEQDNELGDMWHVADDNFTEACTPTAVLAMLAEIERLEVAAFSINGAGGMKLIAERDHLKSELAGLRTGYDAQNNVIADLKAENEALRLPLQYLVDNEDNHDENQAERHMVITDAQCVLAVMAKEASHG